MAFSVWLKNRASWWSHRTRRPPTNSGGHILAAIAKGISILTGNVQAPLPRTRACWLRCVIPAVVQRFRARHAGRVLPVVAGFREGLPVREEVLPPATPAAVADGWPAGLAGCGDRRGTRVTAHLHGIAPALVL
jgi:hypothetical protein